MSYSHNTFVKGTAGHASVAIDDMSRQPKLYTVLIFGDEEERTRDLRQIMQMPSVTAVINCGGMEMGERITSILKESNLGRKDIAISRLERILTEKKTTN